MPPGEGEKDISPHQPLEISSEIAAKADDLLRNFAEEAGLETALIVDRSGALVAGISSEAGVTIDVISALVAGASGAMRALVKELGETGNIESLHQGDDRLLYLREMINRFILVGVSDCTTPAGVVREEASKVVDALQELLVGIRQSDSPKEQKNLDSMKSLRSMSLQRTANRLLAPAVFLEHEEIPEFPVEIVGDAGEVPVPVQLEPIEELYSVVESEPIVDLGPLQEATPEMEEEIFIEEPLEDEWLPLKINGLAPALLAEVGPKTAFEEDEDAGDEPVLEIEPIEDIKMPEPKGILEPLDFGAPEIVIEQPSLKTSLKTSSIEEDEVVFDTEPAKEEQLDDAPIETEVVGTIFEVAEEDEAEPIFEIDSEESEKVEFKSDEEDVTDSGTIFEFDKLESENDESDSPEEPPVIAFEIDAKAEIDEKKDDSADAESEGRTAGPSYF